MKKYMQIVSINQLYYLLIEFFRKHMLFEHQQQTFKSSKFIEGHPQAKRISRRQSRLNQFKIPNPVLNTALYCSNDFVPNMPTAIRNQLQQMEYLSISNINNIGKFQKNDQFPTNKRNSRFSRRLMAMQKALLMQDLKMRNIQSEGMQQTFFSEQNAQNEGNYISIMEQQRNSINMQYVMGENLDRDVDMELDLGMCDQSEITAIEYYSQTDIRPQINYEEYESYLNV